MKIRKDSTSGVTGVRWDSAAKKWVSRICHNKKHLSLGQFTSKDAAVAARKRAEKKYFTHA